MIYRYDFVTIVVGYVVGLPVTFTTLLICSHSAFCLLITDTVTVVVLFVLTTLRCFTVCSTVGLRLLVRSVVRLQYLLLVVLVYVLRLIRLPVGYVHTFCIHVYITTWCCCYGLLTAFYVRLLFVTLLFCCCCCYDFPVRVYVILLFGLLRYCWCVTLFHVCLYRLLWTRCVVVLVVVTLVLPFVAFCCCCHRVAVVVVTLSHYAVTVTLLIAVDC